MSAKKATKSDLDAEIEAALSSSAPKQKKKDDFQPEVVHQKIIRINPMALVSMFMENNEIGVKKGIIAGTRYVGGGYDAATHTFFVNVEYDRWPGVTVGDKLEPAEIELVDLRIKNLDGTLKEANNV